MNSVDYCPQSSDLSKWMLWMLLGKVRVTLEEVRVL